MTPVKVPATIEPNASFRKRVEEKSGAKISACFQCEKCTNGCPVAFAMDIAPHKLMRLVHFGAKDVVLKSDTIWVCASCETCNTRCPNGINIAHVMDSLRQISQGDGVIASQKNVPIFHSTFLSNVKTYGRIQELPMAIIYTLKSGGLPGLIKQSKMGLQMIKRGKLKFFPKKSRAQKEVNNIFNLVTRKASK